MSNYIIANSRLKTLVWVSKFLKVLEQIKYNLGNRGVIMKLKKEHNHKEEELNDTENLMHKKSKVMPKDIEPVALKPSPGGFYGRKWFNHKNKGK